MYQVTQIVEHELNSGLTQLAVGCAETLHGVGAEQIVRKKVPGCEDGQCRQQTPQGHQHAVITWPGMQAHATRPLCHCKGTVAAKPVGQGGKCKQNGYEWGCGHDAVCGLGWNKGQYYKPLHSTGLQLQGCFENVRIVLAFLRQARRCG